MCVPIYVYKVRNHVTKIKYGVKYIYPGMERSKLLYNSQFCVLNNSIDSPEQLGLYFNTDVVRGYLVKKSAYYTDCWTTV